MLLCSEDGESDEWNEWHEIGIEWAIQDLLNEEIDETDQAKVIIGEGEGFDEELNNWVYERIPNAASRYGAIYFLPRDEHGREIPFTSERWKHETNIALWYFNMGWVNLMKLRKSIFYDIGLYSGRPNRGKFYPCERAILEGYSLREERPQNDTDGYTYGECEFWK